MGGGLKYTELPEVRQDHRQGYSNDPGSRHVGGLAGAGMPGSFGGWSSRKINKEVPKNSMSMITLEEKTALQTGRFLIIASHRSALPTDLRGKVMCGRRVYDASTSDGRPTCKTGS